MKKIFTKVLHVLLGVSLITPTMSCEPEIHDTEKEEIQDNPSKNTTDIAVTGSIEKCGFSYAVINGYVNLNLLPPGNDNPSFGVEVKEEGMNEGEQEYSTTLTGNKFSVLCRKLSPTQEYSYRTFVKYGGITHYGEYCKFTTKDFENVAATGEATEITYNSAYISLEKLPNSFDEEEDWMVGLAYSIKESTLQPDSIYSDDCDFKFTPEGHPRHLSNLIPNTTYYYAAFTYVEGKIKFAEIKSFKTENAFMAIDLGLSVDWGNCNVGANAPEDFGGYYAWGETEEKKDYSRETHLLTNLYDRTFDIQGTEYDVAHVKYGDGWRMPTVDEVLELFNNCDLYIDTINGVTGCFVVASNGNSIFLPAAGYFDGPENKYVGSYTCFWLGTAYADGSYGAYFLELDNLDKKCALVPYYSYLGLSVRPVKEKSPEEENQYVKKDTRKGVNEGDVVEFNRKGSFRFTRIVVDDLAESINLDLSK